MSQLLLLSKNNSVLYAYSRINHPLLQNKRPTNCDAVLCAQGRDHDRAKQTV